MIINLDSEDGINIKFSEIAQVSQCFVSSQKSQSLVLKSLNCVCSDQDLTLVEETCSIRANMIGSIKSHANIIGRYGTSPSKGTCRVVVLAVVRVVLAVVLLITLPLLL